MVPEFDRALFSLIMSEVERIKGQLPPEFGSEGDIARMMNACRADLQTAAKQTKALGTGVLSDPVAVPLRAQRFTVAIRAAAAAIVHAELCVPLGVDAECMGHPAGPFDPMGQTVYCDGTCRPKQEVRIDKAALVKAVREHARANYSAGGWDYVVECYEDSDIIEEMGDATTAEEAIKNVGCIVGLRREREEEVRAEVF